MHSIKYLEGNNWKSWIFKKSLKWTWEAQLASKCTKIGTSFKAYVKTHLIAKTGLKNMHPRRNGSQKFANFEKNEKFSNSFFSKFYDIGWSLKVVFLTGHSMRNLVVCMVFLDGCGRNEIMSNLMVFEIDHFCFLTLLATTYMQSAIFSLLK